MFTLQRKGEFVVELADEQCGAKGQRQFSYACEIDAGRLDARGFVLDNDEVHGAFGTFSDGTWRASCEALAAGFVQVLSLLMGGRATRISVTVIPAPGRTISCTWRHGQPLPEYHVLPRPVANPPPRRVRTPELRDPVAAASHC